MHSRFWKKNFFLYGKCRAAIKKLYLRFLYNKVSRYAVMSL